VFERVVCIPSNIFYSICTADRIRVLAPAAGVTMSMSGVLESNTTTDFNTVFWPYVSSDTIILVSRWCTQLHLIFFKIVLCHPHKRCKQKILWFKLNWKTSYPAQSIGVMTSLHTPKILLLVLWFPDVVQEQQARIQYYGVGIIKYHNGAVWTILVDSKSKLDCLGWSARKQLMPIFVIWNAKCQGKHKIIFRYLEIAICHVK
jgi:hypothetical protein